MTDYFFDFSKLTIADAALLASSQLITQYPFIVIGILDRITEGGVKDLPFVEMENLINQFNDEVKLRMSPVLNEMADIAARSASDNSKR